MQSESPGVEVPSEGRDTKPKESPDETSTGSKEDSTERINEEKQRDPNEEEKEEELWDPNPTEEVKDEEQWDPNPTEEELEKEKEEEQWDPNPTEEELEAEKEEEQWDPNPTEEELEAEKEEEQWDPNPTEEELEEEKEKEQRDANATKICFKHKFPESGSLRVPNTRGQRPKTFEIDCLVDTEAIEIKWRDATTDGDHITKEHTRIAGGRRCRIQANPCHVLLPKPQSSYQDSRSPQNVVQRRRRRVSRR